LRKTAELKKIQEKHELQGTTMGKKDPKHMTEEELVAHRLELIAADDKKTEE
jgi:hypothetical protein